MIINLDQRIYEIETGEAMTLTDLATALNKTLERVESGEIKNDVYQFIKEVAKSKDKEITVGVIFRRCLLERIDKEKIEADEAQRRFEIAKEMMAGGEFDLDEKDRDIIKKNMIERYDPIISGQVMSYLNPKVKKEKQKSTKAVKTTS